MNDTDSGPFGDADKAARAAGALAARERQSHVRHELRAPLAVIYPLMSVLVDGDAGELTAQQREYLEVIERNITRLEALITGAAASGWMDCSAASPVQAAVWLRDLAEEAVMLRRGDPCHRPPVMVEVGASSPCSAWADRDDVRQILGGLVRNAAAYAPDGAVVIRVADGDDGTTVMLEVLDSGPGMPPEELARAFEFGFRGELAVNRKVPGLGAGLWICRELARRNGGELMLTSQPGLGVTATLTLPAAEAGPA